MAFGDEGTGGDERRRRRDAKRVLVESGSELFILGPGARPK